MHTKLICKAREVAAQETRIILKALCPRKRVGTGDQGYIGEDEEEIRQLRQVRLLCGSDGLPHLIVSSDQRHWGEFITPGVLFLYIAGWIGWISRNYLIAIRDEKKPTQKEIIIDVPLAFRLLFRGFSWPVAAYRELLNGDLFDSNV